MRNLAFEFGVLPKPVVFEATNWAVEPLPDCQRTIDAWQATGSDATWVYPPMVYTIRQRYSRRTKAVVTRRVPHSVRQARVWRVPATHRLMYHGATILRPDTQKPPIISFIIYLIGMLHGVELQHADWFVTERQHKKTGGLFVHLPKSTEAIIDIAADWFRHASRSVQTCITSALYIHNHVPAYQWDWEGFAWQYAVFDAAWFTACASGAIPSYPLRGRWPQHKRFSALSKAFGMRRDQRQFRKWVRCRNDLIHQVTWGQTIPGHEPRKGVPSYYLPLRSFTTLALLASVGYKGKTVRMPWDTAGQLGLYP